jgi:hypothetical protein
MPKGAKSRTTSQIRRGSLDMELWVGLGTYYHQGESWVLWFRFDDPHSPVAASTGPYYLTGWGAPVIQVLHEARKRALRQGLLEHEEDLDG